MCVTNKSTVSHLDNAFHSNNNQNHPKKKEIPFTHIKIPCNAVIRIKERKKCGGHFHIVHFHLRVQLVSDLEVIQT